WIDVAPYPFGSDGNPVDDGSPACKPSVSGAQLSCYLVVTSLAFRSWNRGLAATSSLTSSTPFGVWIWNGVRWYPDPTFPGTKTGKGDTILGAGKLDYWLVGDAGGTWPSLCRFDGSSFLWEPLPVPKATLARVTPAATDPSAPAPGPAPGGIT